MIDTKNIIIDSKSGYSGAGKNFNQKFNMNNFFKSLSTYSVGSHRHTAEINQELSKVANRKINVFFTPHIIPVFRGILSTIYIKSSKNYNAEKIYKFLKKYHKNNFFIKVAKFNTSIGTSDVLNTNFCRISVCKNRKKIIIISTIDNLVKGASGQAIQNMNVAFNFKENLGLV
jgi:Acetylglutamate semialdehyde dehydrogenase